MGTANLLEALRIKDQDSKNVFAVSNEEYGLVLSFQEQYENAVNDGKEIQDPTEVDKSPIFGIKFPKTKIDQLILENELEYNLEDRESTWTTEQKKILIDFNPDRF